MDGGCRGPARTTETQMHRWTTMCTDEMRTLGRAEPIAEREILIADSGFIPYRPSRTDSGAIACIQAVTPVS